AVGTDQRDSCAELDRQVDAVVHGDVAVALDRAAQLEDPESAALALRETDRGRIFVARRRFQPLDFLELLNPALDQLGLARLVTEAADEGLHVLDFGALI